VALRNGELPDSSLICAARRHRPPHCHPAYVSWLATIASAPRASSDRTFGRSRSAKGLPELEGPAFGISYSTPMGVLRTRQGIGWRTNV
jgi:hypothetical protein